MCESLSPLSATEANSRDSLTPEILLARLQRQLAVIRAIIDEADRVARAADHARSGDAEGLSDRVVEEMARLGCRLLEAAGILASSRRDEDSGVFSRRAASGSAW